jgi:dTDP-4-dehydrorhamnose 3,5-epimerase-like enzyme
VSNEQIVRGGHAHKEIDQIVFCLQGQVQLNLDDGIKQQSLILNSPGWGVRVGPKLWHTLSHFAPHTTVAVIASDFYREDDYLRSRESWQDFLHDHA